MPSYRIKKVSVIFQKDTYSENGILLAEATFSHTKASTVKNVLLKLTYGATSRTRWAV